MDFFQKTTTQSKIGEIGKKSLPEGAGQQDLSKNSIKRDIDQNTSVRFFTRFLSQSGQFEALLCYVSDV